MNHPGNPRLAIGLVLLLAAVLTLILGGCAALVSLLLPTTFTSRVVVAPPGVESEVALEVKRILSREVLLPVVTNLDLPRTYSAEFHAPEPLPVEGAYWLLSQRTTVGPLGDRRLLEIAYAAREPSVAATNANAIAHSYVASTLGRGSGTASQPARVVEPAVPASKPDRPRHFVPIVGILIVGGLLAVGGLHSILQWRLKTLRSMKPSPLAPPPGNPSARVDELRPGPRS